MIPRQPICAVILLLALSSWGRTAAGQTASPQNPQGAATDGLAALPDAPAAATGAPAAPANTAAPAVATGAPAAPANSAAPAGQAFGDISARADGQPVLLGPAGVSQWDVRAGAWGKSLSGSPSKVYEYESPETSAFYNLDGFASNGCDTIGVTVTGSDNQTDDAHAYYYGPNVSATVDYDLFLHQLAHDPLDNMATVNQTTPPAFTGNPSGYDPSVVKQDLGAGQDYALRVQEFKSTIKVPMDDGNVKVRVDVWGLEKDGTRQVNAVAMCFTQTATLPPDHPPVNTFAGSRCHVLSQPQYIDWKTWEVKPVIEAHLGDNFVLEYSRPMRSFTADDSTTSRYYVSTGDLSTGRAYDYAVVPSNYTQMDQLKLSGAVTDNNRLYAYMMVGSNVDELIDMSRWFNDVDMRWTNTSIKNTSLTVYGKIYNEDEQNVNIAELQQPQLNPGVSTTALTNVVRTPIDYHTTTLGMRGTWRPWGCGYDQGGLAITGDYEYCDLNRLDALYPLAATQTVANPSGLPAGSTLDQQHTITNCFSVGPDYRWSAGLDTYLHYKFQDADQPLVGVNASQTVGVNTDVFDTLLPQYDNIVEVGFNWFPCDWFMLNACVGFERGDYHGTPDVDSTNSLANTVLTPISFDEENWPVTINAWYRASDRLTLSGGYSIFSNFVGQNITLADQTAYTGPGSANAPITSKWNYAGQANVVTLGARYALSERITLTGQFEWVRGNDLVYQSLQPTTATGTPVGPQLGTYCRVTNETTRVTLGADWQVRPRVVIFTRYELYNYDDIYNEVSGGFETGLAQGILGGVSALF